MPKPALTLERLCEVLSYDCATGVFMRRDGGGRGFRSDLAGKPAGRVNSSGYHQIGVDGRVYLTHRLVWLYVHGEWPTALLDHIDGDTLNNRLVNLRECTNAENCQNRSAQRNNKSGFMGVHFSHGRWRAQIMLEQIKYFLGSFGTPEEAYAAYLRAKAVKHAFQPTPRPSTAPPSDSRS